MQFSNHPGYGAWRGQVLPAALISDCVEGIAERGVLGRCDAVLTGYIGDAATGALSAYIIYEAWRLGVPRRTLIAMLRNLGIDVVVGVVPVFGDLWSKLYNPMIESCIRSLRTIAKAGARQARTLEVLDIPRGVLREAALPPR